MNSECFFTKSLRRRSSRNSDWSSFRLRMIFVPRLMSPWVLSSSFTTVNEPPAADSQTYCSSSLLFVITVTCGTRFVMASEFQTRKTLTIPQL